MLQKHFLGENTQLEVWLRSFSCFKKCTSLHSRYFVEASKFPANYCKDLVFHRSKERKLQKPSKAKISANCMRTLLRKLVSVLAPCKQLRFNHCCTDLELMLNRTNCAALWSMCFKDFVDDFLLISLECDSSIADDD